MSAPERPRPRADDPRLPSFIGRLLRTGVIAAALVSAAGAVLLLARAPTPLPDYGTFRGEPAALRSVAGTLRGAAAFQPRAVMELGLLILIATPIARVALAAVGFVVERDRLYVGVALAVLALLIVSLAR